jgi:N-acyl-D-amino-acid deacylase
VGTFRYLVRLAPAVTAIVVTLTMTASLRGQTYDLLIRGGRIVDGTGAPAYFADVAVTNGRIAALGRNLPGTALSEFDATGLTVAPGFIDVHTHAEEIDETPAAENFLRMGVTTLILGNCGSSTLDVQKYFTRLEGIRVSPNIATLIGHGSVRNQVMGGAFMRPPTEPELEAMRGLVDRALLDGALGLSTGLIYLPGTFAKTDELIALARTVARHDGIYVSHMRDEGRAITAALDELFQIARDAGCRAQVSHIKLSGPPNWGRARQILDRIEAARAGGLDITQDQYVYTASSTGMSQLIPEAWREGGRFKENLADAAKRARMVEQMRTNLFHNGRSNYAYAVIADYSANRALNGMNIVEAAQHVRGSNTIDAQIELLLEIQAHDGASGVFHGIHEEDLRVFLRHANTMLGSDSSVRKFQHGVPHPRGYGNAARVLRRYVREESILRLEDAIRRMTSLPAVTFRLVDRGQVRAGAFADLAVFDAKTVTDTASYEDPHHYASGFGLVVVNGVVVVRHDEHTGARPGQMLRRGR